MYTTPNLGLKVWDADADAFNRADLITNWTNIDADYARQRSANQVEPLAAVPGSGNFDGRLVYLTAASGDFPAKTVIRYNGSSWAAVGPTPEILAALPTTNNYQGRIVVLTASSGGFAANDVVVNTTGSTSWKKVGGIGSGVALPGSPVAGDLFLLIAAASGFEAYSLVVYNGSAWARVEKRGVEVGTTLPVSPYAGQLFVVTTAVGGFQAYDVVRYDGSVWGKINSSGSYVSGSWPVSPLDGDIIFVPWGVASGRVGHFRYNSGSASAYKWEHIGAGPILNIAAINGQITVPKTGEYFVNWGVNYSGVNQGNNSAVWVRDITASADLTGIVAQGSGGTQKTGTTIAHQSAGGSMQTVTLTGGNVIQLMGNIVLGYTFVTVPALPYMAIQPIRVQAT